MDQKRVTIHSCGYEFTATVSAFRDYRSGRIHTHGISVGITTAGKPCVSISVTAEHDDERLRSALPAHIAALNQVHYAPCCSAAPPLRRGGGSAVMVRAACRLALKNFTWVTTFKLIDSSSVECNGREVSLPELSLCCHGMTWYERAFGAKLADVACHKAYRQLVEERLLAPAAKPSSFASFCAEAAVPEGVRSLLEPVYDMQPSIVAFFSALRDQLTGEDGQPAFCAIVGNWVAPFVAVRLQGLHKGEWHIPAAAFSTCSVFNVVDDDYFEEVSLQKRSWCCQQLVAWGDTLCLYNASLPIEEL